MYRRTPNQMALLDNPVGFMVVRLEPDKRWVKMAKLISRNANDDESK